MNYLSKLELISKLTTFAILSILALILTKKIIFLFNTTSNRYVYISLLLFVFLLNFFNYCLSYYKIKKNKYKNGEEGLKLLINEISEYILFCSSSFVILDFIVIKFFNINYKFYNFLGPLEIAIMFFISICLDNSKEYIIKIINNIDKQKN